MQMVHFRREEIYNDFDEIIVEVDRQHIYGYRNEEAVEIAEPYDFLFESKWATIRDMCVMSNFEKWKKYWKRTHRSELEERYEKESRCE